MPRAMSRRTCLVCGQQVSTNGLAQASHKRKHVREGLLVQMDSRNTFLTFSDRIDYSTWYVTPQEARRRLDEETLVDWHVIAGTPAPKPETTTKESST